MRYNFSVKVEKRKGDDKIHLLLYEDGYVTETHSFYFGEGKVQSHINTLIDDYRKFHEFDDGAIASEINRVGA